MRDPFIESVAFWAALLITLGLGMMGCTGWAIGALGGGL